jgi:hypothetical protein
MAQGAGADIGAAAVRHDFGHHRVFAGEPVGGAVTVHDLGVGELLRRAGQAEEFGVGRSGGTGAAAALLGWRPVGRQRSVEAVRPRRRRIGCKGCHCSEEGKNSQEIAGLHGRSLVSEVRTGISLQDGR